MPAISTQVKKKETPEERAKRRLPFKPPANRSPFLELPAELRAMIFRYALTRRKPITLRPDYFRRPPQVDGQKLVKVTRALRVNKQFHQEAGPAFYSNNVSRFELSIPKEMDPIMVKIAGFREYLTHVEIIDRTGWYYPYEEGFRIDKFYSIFRNLQGCTHLKTLTMPHNSACVFIERHECKTEKAWARSGRLQICNWLETTELLQETEGRKKARPIFRVASPKMCVKCTKANTKSCYHLRSRRCQRDCTLMERHCKELASKSNGLKSSGH